MLMSVPIGIDRAFVGFAERGAIVGSDMNEADVVLDRLVRDQFVAGRYVAEPRVAG